MLPTLRWRDLLPGLLAYFAKPIGWCVLALVVGLVAGWRLKPSPAPLPSGLRTVVVHDTVSLYKEMPKASPGLAERLTTTRVAPRVTITTDVPQDTARAMRYARFALAADSFRLARIARGIPKLTEMAAPTDSAGPLSDSLSHPPAILPPFAGRYDGHRLRLWSTLSDGRAWYAEYDAPAPLAFVSADSSVTVRARSRWLRLGLAVGRCASLGGVGAVAGELIAHRPALGGVIGCAGSVAF
jgi:hypothetical protein